METDYAKFELVACTAYQKLYTLYIYRSCKRLHFSLISMNALWLFVGRENGIIWTMQYV